MTLDELTKRLTQVFHDAGLLNEVLMERRLIGDVERLLLTRKLNDSTRYLRLTPVLNADRAWDFEVLGGSYGNSDSSKDFDGRRGGDADYVVKIVRLWLVDLADWSNVPSFESQK